MSLAFDDSTWEVIDAPHDFIITGRYDPNIPGSGHSYLNRTNAYCELLAEPTCTPPLCIGHALACCIALVRTPDNDGELLAVDRKHFNLPSSWNGSSVRVYFEGVFHNSQMYLNGRFLGLHLCGYTGFTYRIDNISGIKFGAGKQNENVLAAYVDGSRGRSLLHIALVVVALDLGRRACRPAKLTGSTTDHCCSFPSSNLPPGRPCAVLSTATRCSSCRRSRRFRMQSC